MTISGEKISTLFILATALAILGVIIYAALLPTPDQCLFINKSWSLFGCVQ
jgi:hypothetical protein